MEFAQAGAAGLLVSDLCLTRVTRYSVPNPINRSSLGSDNDSQEERRRVVHALLPARPAGPRQGSQLAAGAGGALRSRPLADYAPVPAAAEGQKNLDTFKEPPPVMPVGQDRVSAAGPDRLTGSFAETGWKEDRMNATTYRLAALAATCLIAPAPAHAQREAPPDDDQPTGAASTTTPKRSKANELDIAKELQYPVGNLTILPLELLPQEARRPWHRRRHHHRQWPRERHSAGWREHAVPRSERHELGRRMARSGFPAMAEEDQGRFGLQRHRLSLRHVPDLAGGRQRSGCDPRSSSTAARSEARPSRFILTATTGPPLP